MAAADRGVRVRLLPRRPRLKELLPRSMRLDSHANLEVRVFNPFAEHGGSFSRMAQFLGDARRLNRRMHNKLFIADNQVLVMGGRNIGDEYFSASGAVNFRDLDVIAIGPVVQEASAQLRQVLEQRRRVPDRRGERGREGRGRTPQGAREAERRSAHVRRLGLRAGGARGISRPLARRARARIRLGPCGAGQPTSWRRRTRTRKT
jgi:phosphatidylserine/phosphatidylglycerophosphate/cardiolipin synthase-like enzyme